MVQDFVRTPDSTNVSDKITDINVNIFSTNELGEKSYYVQNNTKTDLYMYNGMYYSFDISWTIPEKNFRNQIKSGDYFYISLENSSFHFKDTDLNNPLIYEEKQIGVWGITNDRIYCEFTEDAGNSLSASGSFQAEGSLNCGLRESATITIGGVDLDVNVNPLKLPKLEIGGDAISKYGTNLLGSNEISWHILLNYAYATNYYVNHIDNLAQGVKVIDNLEDNDLIFDSSKISINVPINLPTYDDETNKYVLSSINGANLNLLYSSDTTFTVFNEETHASSKAEWSNAFNNMVTLHPETPAYGFSADRKSCMIYLGNLPDTLVYATSKEDFKQLVKSSFKLALTDTELDSLADIYGETKENGSVYYPARALDIVLTSIPESGKFASEKYENSANVTTTFPQDFSQINTGMVEINTLSGDIRTSEPKTVTLTKKDADTTKPIEGAYFRLLRKEAPDTFLPYPDSSTSPVSTDEKGQITIENLVPGTYKFEETAAAPGYDIHSFHATEFTVNDTDTNGIFIDATNKVLPKNITITKIWDDEHNKDQVRPDSIQVVLRANGVKKATATLTATNAVSGNPDKWEYTFNNLPVYDNMSGAEIQYTIDEVAPFDNYTTQINGYTITNTCTYVSKSATLTKIDYDTNKAISGAVFKLQKLVGDTWEDYKDSHGTVILKTTDNTGKLTFTGLDSGEYKFVEVSAAPGYDADKITYSSADGIFDIVNRDTPDIEITATNAVLPTSITITKVWDDSNNEHKLRPNQIQVELLNGDKVVSTATLSSKDKTDDNTWTYTFNQLPMYNPDHTLADYSVRESSTNKFYTTSVEGFVITNTCTFIAKRATLVKKDATTNDVIQGARFILEKLNEDGTTWSPIGTEKVTDENGQVSFDGLEIGTYRFTESKAAFGYDLTSVKYAGSNEFHITGTEVSDVTVTATNKQITKDLHITKIWVDDDNVDQVRPDKITLKLSVDDKELRRINLSSQNVGQNPNIWSYTISDLPVYNLETQQEINYKLEEITPENYSSEIQSSADGNDITITNTCTYTSKKATLIKKDKTTGFTLPGAEFKLQKMDTQNHWTDLETNLSTDKDGMITVTNLGIGTYRFVETKAATGYNIKSAEYSLESFTISGRQSADVTIECTNTEIEKEPIIETTTETTTIPESTTPKETTTVPESTTQKETTTVPESTTQKETTTVPESTTPKETTTVPESTTPKESTTVPESTTQKETTTISESTTQEETTTTPESTTLELPTTAPETTTPKSIISGSDSVQHSKETSKQTETSSTKSQTPVKTGDTLAIGFFILLFGSASVIIMFSYNRKENENE